ncbi:MAG: ATP-dependent DNA helicase RecG [Rickettsiales bacterium]
MKILSNISYLKGVGPTTRKLISKLVSGDKIIDLLLHIPNSVIIRSLTDDYNNIASNQILTTEILINNHKESYKSSPYIINCCNKLGKEVTLSYFNSRKYNLKTLLPIGETRIISGKATIFNGKLNFINPDRIFTAHNFKNYVEPVYPLTQGLFPLTHRKIIKQALTLIEEIPEWQDEHIIKKYNFPKFKEALIKLHSPDNLDDLTHDSIYLKRLAYDEMLAMQLALRIARSNQLDFKQTPILGSNILAGKLLALLPFALTKAQNQALSDIRADLASTNKMTRLLQGDVGCGKTIVAALAILDVIEAGKQAAFMAPTSVLAKQHDEFFSEYFPKLKIKTALITSATKGKKRKEILAKLANGEINLLIGTHALIYDAVNFNNLGLVIIDEQHRFGVEQRLKLVEKGQNTNFLLMSATPIPRTLALTLYGDLEVTSIMEKPANRKNIVTRIISNERIAEILTAIARALKNGEKIYWVCPLIEESEQLSMTNLEDRYQEFSKIFGQEVGFIHGKMKPEEKNKILADFINGKIKILLATTVIEVGVNVVDATIMVIEHAENFGLAQLHQLRGRVGRGNQAGKCILLYDKNLISKTSFRRLAIMRDSNDGFKIAEEDLKIRGGGEVLGTKQSGMPEFKFASINMHFELLKIAQQDAKLLLEGHNEHSNVRLAKAQNLLKIFGYEYKFKFKNLG